MKKMFILVFCAMFAFAGSDIVSTAKSTPSVSSMPELGEQEDQGEPNESEQRVQECTHKDSSTMGIVACIRGELAIQDKILNERYKEAMQILKPERQKQLKDIQRKWIAFKEANCEFMPQGTMYRIVAANCYLDLTRERVEWLDFIINGFEGEE